ncbi:hypothetical protein NKH49_20945 [Mesorhizobium sp. M1088]|uniref:hypothetical protein n=1 Tax=Mesorhizobium sp. M1088 TaxID=2957056 RepID=UPI003335EA4D
MENEIVSMHDIERSLGAYSVCFASVENPERAISAGSGSLVRIGERRGVMTARHVLDELPDKGEVPFLDFGRPDKQRQKHLLVIQHCRRFDLPENDRRRDVPDLAFLQLPANEIVRLEALGCSFHNLSRNFSEPFPTGFPKDSFIDVVAGVVEEFSEALLSDTGGLTTAFTTLPTFAKVVGQNFVGGYDIKEVTFHFDEDMRRPTTYGGMSGGALWRIFAERVGETGYEVHRKYIFGVAFHQSSQNEAGDRIISCHGPASIIRLHDVVAAA